VFNLLKRIPGLQAILLADRDGVLVAKGILFKYQVIFKFVIHFSFSFVGFFPFVVRISCSFVVPCRHQKGENSFSSPIGQGNVVALFGTWHACSTANEHGSGTVF
jgi:hypothetical protein